MCLSLNKKITWLDVGFYYALRIVFQALKLELWDMSFIFRDWNAFVLECLDLSRSNQISVDDSKREECLNKSVEYKESVENRVIEFMLSKAKNREKKQYIKLLEIMLVNVGFLLFLSLQVPGSFYLLLPANECSNELIVSPSFPDDHVPFSTP